MTILVGVLCEKLNLNDEVNGMRQIEKWTQKKKLQYRVLLIANNSHEMSKCVKWQQWCSQFTINNIHIVTKCKYMCCKDQQTNAKKDVKLRDLKNG